MSAPTAVVICCDHSDDGEILCPEFFAAGPRFKASDVRNAAKDAGWAYVRSGRSNYDFCPRHATANGTNRRG